MQFSNEERETIIRFDRAGDECTIYTADSMVMTKLDKIYKCVKEYRDGGKVYAKEYTTNKRLISFRSKIITREFSKERKKELSDRMKRMHNKPAS